MSDNPENVVVDYIQQLLAESDSAAESIKPGAKSAALTHDSEPQKAVETAKAAQLKEVNVQRMAENMHSQAEMEAIKRAQLEKLLQPAINIPPTLEPIKPVEVPQQAIPTAAREAPRHDSREAKAEDRSTGFKPPQTPSAPAVAEINEDSREALAQPLLQWHENGRPVWAQDRFDVLLFKVAGLTLAVPLIALGQIHPLTEDLTPIFGQAEWFIGLQPSSHGKIRCVNTAMFVMPERYQSSFVETAKYVVSIDGLDWGLVVDEVQQPRRIHPDEVTWRGERSKRPWLAGTVRSAMCALIDIPQMGQLLEASDAKRSK